MLTGTTFNTRMLAEDQLAEMGWVETALNTWTSPDGCHVASFTDFCGAVVQVTVREVGL